MYSESKKDQNKTTHQPIGHQRNVSKAKALVDNRSITQLQKKNAVLIKSTVKNGIVQRILDRKVEDKLVGAIRANDKKKFKRIFHYIDPGKDEMISCEVTFQECRLLLNRERSMRNLLRQSHKTRHSTHGMGHMVKDKKGKVLEFAHPTSVSRNVYARHRTPKGNPSWRGHGTFDRERSKYVRKSRSIRGKRDRSIAYSYNVGAQPPYASNSLAIPLKKSRKSRKMHNERERMKRKHRRYDPLIMQDYRTPWYPDKRKRGVSPDRGDL